MLDFLRKLFSKPEPLVLPEKPPLLPKKVRQQKVVTQNVIRIVERELGSLTLAQWQQDAALCAQSRNVLTSPIVRQMLQVLHNSHPAFQTMMAGDINERALFQRFCEGYTSCLADFESMGKSVVPPENVEAEFGAEEIPESELEKYKSPKPK